SNHMRCGRYKATYTGDASSVKYKGVYHAGSQTKIVSIGDGTSNTIGFGEVASGKYYNPTTGQFRANFRQTWMGAGSMATIWGLQPRGVAPAGTWGPHQFSSRHGAGGNFAYCDGSVRTTSRTYDYNAFQSAAGANGVVVYNIN